MRNWAKKMPTVQTVHEYLSIHELSRDIIEKLNEIYEGEYQTKNFIEELDELEKVTSVSMLVEDGNILCCCTFKDRLKYILMENLVSYESGNGHASTLLREAIYKDIATKVHKPIVMAAEEAQLDMYRNFMIGLGDKRVKLLKEFRKTQGSKFIGNTGIPWAIFYCKSTKIKYKYAFVMEYQDPSDHITLETSDENTHTNPSPRKRLSSTYGTKTSKHVKRIHTPPSNDY